MTSGGEDLTGNVLLGKLQVTRLLGRGGMGSVYEVEHLVTHHRRALKVLHAEGARRPASVERFLREAGVAGKLASSHVVETFDAGRLEDGRPYVLMELLEGRDLAEIFAAPEPLATTWVVAAIEQVLEALAVAHAAGIVHRDVKPENVFVVREPGGAERIKLLDFGISLFAETEPAVTRLTYDGIILGTPHYMAPEQALGAVVGPRADLYSVGVMLYEGLARRLPYDATTIPALLSAVARGEREPLGERVPWIPRALVAVVERAMAHDPAARFAGALEMRDALRASVEGVSVEGVSVDATAGTLRASAPSAAHSATLEVPAPGDPSAATTRLRRQHADLGELATTLAGALEPLEIDAALRAMARLSGLLKVHAAMEDEVLYPRLLAHEDPSVRAVAQRYRAEFGDAYGAFFRMRAGWASRDAVQAKPEAFVADVRAAIGALGSRIRHENEGLYAMVDALER